MKNISKFAFLFIAAFLSLASISCKNFMNGDDLLSELNDQIWIANHKRATAKIISPVASPDGDYRNASIIVSFTKTMNPENFEKGFIISDGTGVSLREHYTTPEWNEDNTQFILPANETNLLQVPENGYTNIKLEVTLDFKDSENVPVAEPVSETFKINSQFDNEKPVFIAAKLAKDFDTVNKIVKDENDVEIDNPELFISGELSNAEQESLDNILNTNHINNKICMYIEGHDYGDNIVFAKIKYKKITTVSGREVTEPEYTQTVELTDIPENTTNSSKEITLDLSESKFSDGLYKVDIFLSDAKNNNSEETKTFYITRDTVYNLSYKAVINTCLTDWRQPTETRPITISNIKDGLLYIYLQDFTDDTFMVYGGKTYATALVNSKANISYGFSPDDIKGTVEAVELWGENGTFVFQLPEEIYNFQNQNLYSNIYIEAQVFDTVGNSAKRVTYIPATPRYFIYTIDGNNVALHFENMQGINFANSLNLSEYTIEARTRVYFGKKTAGTTENDIVLQRNFAKSFAEDPWDNYSDKVSFTMDDPNAEYIAVIQNCYVYYRSDSWAGSMFGTYTVISGISKNGCISDDFTCNMNLTSSDVTKIVNAKNSGTTTITVNTDNLPKLDGVTYFYGWSPDNGTTWNYYSSNKFTVNTLINPPEYSDWYYLTESEKNNHSNVYDHRDITLLPSAYETKGKLKVFAQKNNKVKQSNEIEISFSNTEDNIPPEISSWKATHDLTMSADGSYFYTDNSITIDKEWNDAKFFTYYYKPYEQTWGNNVDFLSEKEILNIPTKANQQTYFTVWSEEDTHRFNHGQNTNIPVNGLADGDYMFFITVNDTYGNSATGTIGKVHIGTFKNKINASYKDNTITATLALEPNENFENNHMYVQFYNSDANLNYHWQKFSYDPYGDHGYWTEDLHPRNENWYSSNVMTKADGQLSFTSGSNLTYSGNNNYKGITLPQNTFYKLVVTSYNTDPDSTLQIDKNTGYHYYEDIGEVYDSFINETASAPKYMYVPAQTGVTSFVEKNTCTVKSNRPVLVNIISSLVDLGATDENIDEWERRGKVLYSAVYNEGVTSNTTVSFTRDDIIQKISESGENGHRYCAAVYHFADNTAAISNLIEVTSHSN